MIDNFQLKIVVLDFFLVLLTYFEVKGQKYKATFDLFVDEKSHKKESIRKNIDKMSSHNYQKK